MITDLLQRIVTVVLASFVLIFLCVVGIGLFLQRAWFPFVGGLVMTDLVIWLLALGILPLAALIVGIVWLLRGRYVESGPSGGYLLHLFGTKALPPLLPVTPRIAGATNIATIKPNIPRLGDMLDSFFQSTEGRLEVFQGYRQDETPRYGPWPGVIGVSGAQNVGKSVTITTLVVMALLQHARVVVCDTHYQKSRSLYKKLVALEEWITFAKTEQEVLAEAQHFSTELANRKRGGNPYPYVFVLDEAASILKRSEIGRDVIPMIEEGSQEGQGFNMTIILGIHDFSQDGLGDVRIRGFLNFIYCHRMEPDQAKFIQAFNTRKTKAMIAKLPPGHTVAKDETNEVEYLIMPFADSKDALRARERMLHLSPGPAKPLTISPSTEHVRLIESGGESGESTVKRPAEPGESLTGPGASGESLTSPGENVVSSEDRDAVILAISALVDQGRPLTREGIKEYLGWNNRKHWVVKAVCDKYGIAC